MCNMKKSILTLCLLGASFSSLAEATIGLAVAAGQTPYKNYDNAVMPLPIIKYQKDRFYIDSFKVGVNVVNKTSTKIDIHASYLPLEFRGSKTDDKQLKKLNKRRSTLLSGIGISQQFNQQKTAIKANLSTDILNNSNSALAEIELNHHFQISEKLVIAPNAGVFWSNKNHNNYYYGVSSKEAAKSGLKQYTAKNSAHPYLGISMHYGLTDDISLFASGRVDFLPSEVKDSPMVGRSTTSAIAIGAAYTFK